MSSPPPNAPNGEGSEIGVTDVRGAARTGRAVWILTISLALAVVLVLGVWVLHSHSLSTVTHPQARDFSNRDISTYHEASPGARGSPGDQPAANAQ